MVFLSPRVSQLGLVINFLVLPNSVRDLLLEEQIGREAENLGFFDCHRKKGFFFFFVGIGVWIDLRIEYGLV